MFQTYSLTVTHNGGYFGKVRKLALFAKTRAGEKRSQSNKYRLQRNAEPAAPDGDSDDAL